MFRFVLWGFFLPCFILNESYRNPFLRLFTQMTPVGFGHAIRQLAVSVGTLRERSLVCLEETDEWMPS